MQYCGCILSYREFAGIVTSPLSPWRYPVRFAPAVITIKMLWGWIVSSPPGSNKSSIFSSTPCLHERALLTFARPSGYRGHPQTEGPQV